LHAGTNSAACAAVSRGYSHGHSSGHLPTRRRHSRRTEGFHAITMGRPPAAAAPIPDSGPARSLIGW